MWNIKSKFQRTKWWSGLRTYAPEKRLNAKYLLHRKFFKRLHVLEEEPFSVSNDTTLLSHAVRRCWFGCRHQSVQLGNWNLNTLTPWIECLSDGTIPWNKIKCPRWWKSKIALDAVGGSLYQFSIQNESRVQRALDFFLWIFDGNVVPIRALLNKTPIRKYII